MTGEEKSTYRAGKWAKAVAILILLVIVVLVTLYWMEVRWIYKVFNYVVDKIHKDLEVNINLARGLAALVWLPFFYFLKKTIGPFGGRRRMVGLAGLSVYVAAYSFLLWNVERQKFFPQGGPEQPPIRFYVATPSGYRFFDEGGRDPATGLSRKPVTEEVVADWHRRQAREGLKSYRSLDEVPGIFNTGDGSNLLWYSGDPEGDITWYTGPGFDPRTGKHLQPYTADVHASYQTAAARRQQQTARTRQAQREQGYLEHYVNAGALAEARRAERAVIVAVLDGESGGRSFEGKLAASLKRKGLAAFVGILMPSAFASPVYEALARGDRSELSRLGLDGLSGALLVGRMHSGTPSPSSVQGALSVSASLSLTSVPLNGGAPASSEISVVGAGIDGPAALNAARDRLLDAALADPVIAGLQP